MMTLLEGNNTSQNYYDLMLRVILFNGDDLDGYDEQRVMMMMQGNGGMRCSPEENDRRGGAPYQHVNLR